MTLELFPQMEVFSLSPRLLWMEKHRIVTLHVPEDQDNPWYAAVGSIRESYQKNEEVGRGSTEEAALMALAWGLGIKSWKQL